MAVALGIWCRLPLRHQARGGAESLSEFTQAMHLDTHVASSASSLRQLKQRVNQALLDYETSQSEHCQPSEGQGICVGADETFFGLPVLVLIELASGYIFIETECENRTYETWMEQVKKWWDSDHGTAITSSVMEPERW